MIWNVSRVWIIRTQPLGLDGLTWRWPWGRARCARYPGTKSPRGNRTWRWQHSKIPPKSWSVQLDSHDVVLDLDEELLHGEDVVGDVERADGDEERRVVQADQLAQHLSTDVALGGVQSYILLALCLSQYS